MPRSKKKNKSGGRGASSSATSPQRCGPKGAHQVVEGVYISGEHFAQSQDRLMSIGAASVVACGCRAHHPDRFRYMEVHLSDSASANVGRHLHPVADFIASSLRRGAVLVHCKAGICRSATMVAAYLLKYRRDDLAPTAADALAVIRRSRPCANPRPEFVSALDQFSREILWKEEIHCESSEADDSE